VEVKDYRMFRSKESRRKGIGWKRGGRNKDMAVRRKRNKSIRVRKGKSLGKRGCLEKKKKTVRGRRSALTLNATGKEENG